MPSAVTSVALGDLGHDQTIDVAVAAGHELLVIHGQAGGLPGARQATAADRLERRSLPFGVGSMLAGDFTGDRRTATVNVEVMGRVFSLLYTRNSQEEVSRGPFAPDPLECPRKTAAGGGASCVAATGMLLSGLASGLRQARTFARVIRTHGPAARRDTGKSIAAQAAEIVALRRASAASAPTSIPVSPVRRSTIHVGARRSSFSVAGWRTDSSPSSKRAGGSASRTTR